MGLELTEILTVGNFAMGMIGLLVGILFGAIPGMTATMAIAVFLPLTYAYSLVTSLFLLLGMYVGGISGGLIPAILINIPGTPSSITTCFDGHPMTLRGEGERALKIGITSSLIGGLISLGCLTLFTPVLAQLAINFSAVEKFLVILFAMTIIAALSKGDMLTGIFMGFLGVLVALMGTFDDNNKLRLVPYIFRKELIYGFALLPVLIGLFALGQMFEEAEGGMRKRTIEDKDVLQRGGRKFSFLDFKGQFINLLRSSLLGTLIGVMPGVGGSAACIVAYSQAKTFSKTPEKFGTGHIEGLVASESANNGLTGGALIPLLSMGIPGDSTTAVLVGAFALQGLQIGPLFIQEQHVLWTTVLIALLFCNIMMFITMFFPIKYIAKVIYIPRQRLYPVIILMCIVGAYRASNGVMFDVWSLIVFGALGYFFSKFKLPSTPFLIGFILGGDLEKHFVDALKGNNGNPGIFFTRGPICWVLWLLIVGSVAYSVYFNKKGKPLPE
ncbi:MAG: tripartite tricarboxylate transporter permease [Spirochaetales bacterium]|jgi:putative tricarboxylic transport membrane protein|nr:tripartite tricarboxylate transporter permease [Spirochaetales bacterium]